MDWYHWVTLLFGSGVLIEINRQIFKRLDDNKQRTEAISLGVQAILRNNLKKEYETAIVNGYAPVSDKENFENMYVQYHNLGANGVMDGIRDEYMALPTFPKEGL